LKLKASLRQRPVLYEIVPPRRDSSKFHTELRGVEAVLGDDRITAINVPELLTRSRGRGRVHYSPATIPPEEYAMMIKDYKEAVVNVIAPRLGREEFLLRIKRILHEYRIPNLVVVGKERHTDSLPGPSVLEGLRLLRAERRDDMALGGICIFGRVSSKPDEYGRADALVTEPSRVWAKARAGCDFVTSQITFDSKPVLEFLTSYQRLCEETGEVPLTVFISLTTIPSTSILSLVESLDVVIPSKVRKRLTRTDETGPESLKVATEVFQEIMAGADESGIRIPLGLQIEQIGVFNDDLSLQLLDEVYPILRSH
jgi:5,10-methylenetetrahydrofolate reductase